MISCWVIPKEKYLRSNQFKVVCALNPWTLGSSGVCLDVRKGFCCLPFLHALAMLLRNSKHSGKWKLLGYMVKSPPDTFGMTCLVNVLGSSFLCIRAGDTLTLGWNCWILGGVRNLGHPTSPVGCTIVAEHLLKGRSAILHQGASPPEIQGNCTLVPMTSPAPVTQTTVGQMLPGKFKTSPTQESQPGFASQLSLSMMIFCLNTSKRK